MNIKKEKYNKLFMDSASLAAGMSFCTRKKVGAVLVKNNRILVNSWNGTVEGEDNCCEKKVLNERIKCRLCDTIGDIDGKVFKYISDSDNEERDIKCLTCSSVGYSEIYPETIKVTLDTVVHAEKNAIAYAAKEGIKTEGCSMYVTLSPCVPCAVLMKQAGIKKVFYKEEYRDTSGIEALKSMGIKVKQLD